ncbi:hypothetical protein ACWED2_05565 [Amycolatopsis sp. NPDC005003]
MDETKVEQGLTRARRGRNLIFLLLTATIGSVAALIILLGRPRVPDAAITGFVTAVITGVVSIVLAAFNYFDRQREADERLATQTKDRDERTQTRQEENIFHALEYFTGRTQRRNVGISIIEGYWHDIPRLRGILIPLLVNQGKYLLLQSENTDSEHETDNCIRIMQLLTAPSKLQSRDSDSNFDQYYQELQNAIDERLGRREDPDKQHQPRGVKVSEKYLNEWKEQLEAKLTPH